MAELKRSPLFPIYEKYGAKTVDFGGWELPVQYSSLKEEHEAVRTKAGLFDVSNMGEIIVKGPKAAEFLQYMTTNDVSKLVPNKSHYTFLCYEDGGTVDDLIVYMLAENEYLLVVNGANTDKDYEWLVKHNTYEASEVEVTNESDNYAQLALQGPLSESVLQELTDIKLDEIKPFGFEQNVEIKGIEDKVIVSRSGYTGEDGFEIYLPPASSTQLFDLILETGKDRGVVPAGLGARDTLRFEANLALYGQEISEDITPIEAGMKFAVKLDKDSDFIGKEALQKEAEEGRKRRIVGLEMIDKGIPRTGYDVLHEDTVIGHITTGTQSPTLGKNVGRALIDAEYYELGKELYVQVRKRKLKAKIVKTPFYKRGN